MQVEGNTLILRKPAAKPRSGWAEASKRIADLKDDALVIPDFENEADRELKW